MWRQQHSHVVPGDESLGALPLCEACKGPAAVSFQGCLQALPAGGESAQSSESPEGLDSESRLLLAHLGAWRHGLPYCGLSQGQHLRAHFGCRCNWCLVSHPLISNLTCNGRWNGGTVGETVAGGREQQPERVLPSMLQAEDGVKRGAEILRYLGTQCPKMAARSH